MLAITSRAARSGILRGLVVLAILWSGVFTGGLQGADEPKATGPVRPDQARTDQTRPGREDRGREERRRPEFPRQVNPERRAPEKREPVAQGFVFIAGKFVPGPYEIEERNGEATINGQVVSFTTKPAPPVQELGPRFTSASPQDQLVAQMQGNGPPRDWRPGGGPPSNWRPGNGPPGNWPPGNGSGRDSFNAGARSVRQELSENGMVLALAELPAIVLKQREAELCLKVLLDRDPDGQALAKLVETLPPNFDVETLSNWATAYTPVEPFLTPAMALLTSSEARTLENYHTIQANRRLQAFAYPLTMFGMVMSVLSLGHLLQSAPRPKFEVVSDAWKNELAKATVYSLGLVIVLSALDLVWTVLASQAGQMTEINPIGNQLIESASLLSLFKALATLGSCALLFCLRHHSRAQLAAWWICLICTVLTFRWLVLHSMFIT